MKRFFAITTLLAAAVFPVHAGELEDELFGDLAPAKQESSSRSVRGVLSGETAYTFGSPAHWSKGRVGLELSTTGAFESVRYKVCARGYTDPVIAHSEHLSPVARRGERSDFALCEAYMDFENDALVGRIGNQYVVWGEMVGTFIGDVASPRDLRDGYVRSDIARLRLPQWAVRLERDVGDVHADFVWIPKATVDKVGRPGATFSPYTPLGVTRVEKDKADGMNTGLRLGTLVDGWDLSAFVYRSTSVAPVLERHLTTRGVVFREAHDRITQVGGTFTKDMDTFVLKGEAVYTNGRRFQSAAPNAPLGLQESGALDYALGVDIPFTESEGRVNLQVLQSVLTDHDASLYQDQVETAASVLVSARVAPKVEVQALAVYGLNRGDRFFSSQISYDVTGNVRATVGAEVYMGDKTGYFGRWGDNDRAFGEIRYSF